jgi:hypothetical protein
MWTFGEDTHRSPVGNRSLGGENVAEGYLPVLVVTAEPDHKLLELEA